MNLKIGSCSYNAEKKAQFKKEGLALLRKVAKICGLPKGSFDVRFNVGGGSVSGDCILHGEDVYVQINLDVCDWVLVRTCKGRKDYHGGLNRSYPLAVLAVEGVEGLAEFVQDVRGELIS